MGVVIIGHLFVQDAESRQERFVAFGLPRAFFADLRAAVQQFEEALAGMAWARDVQTAAKVGITGQLEAGLSAVRHLDVVVKIQFADDPQTLAVWARNRKVEQPVWRRPREPMTR